MSYAELTELAGQPDETAASVMGCGRVIFGNDTYLDLLIAGVTGGKVVILASGGKSGTTVQQGHGGSELLRARQFRRTPSGGTLGSTGDPAAELL